MSGPCIAVTGATGFVGGHLIGELLSCGYQPVVVARASSDVARLPAAVEVRRAELGERESLARAFAGCYAVIHLAGAVDFGSAWPRFVAANVVGTANVIAAAKMAGVNRMVHGSSIVAIGASRTPRKLDEAAPWNLGPAQVPYVTTKRRAEELALAANAIVVNLASVIGPDDFTDSEFGVLCRRFWRGRLPIHFGGGLNYVDVRDAAVGLRLALERGRAGERYILGGNNRSTTAFFGELARASGQPVPRFRMPDALAPTIAWLEEKFASGRRRRAYLSPGQAKLAPWFFYYDCAKAHRELGFTARPLTATIADAHAFWTRAAA